MNSYEKFYRENLYPLQDGVMSIIRRLNTPFFLTGGTALSRHYFNHRFSDDLDLFVNSNDLFQQLLDSILHSLSAHESAEFALEKGCMRRFESFAQVFVYKPSVPDVKMKIDFVNWTREPDYNQIRADLDRISEDIFYGRENSLKKG